MPTHIERLWNPQDSSGLSRRDRFAGTYRAYVPDELGTELPELGSEARAAAEEALTALVRADERIGIRGRYLNHLLIRSESISSSWIEGNRVTPKRLAIAELLEQGSRVALGVVANVRATEDAIDELGDPALPVTVDDIVRLQHVIEPSLPEGVRRAQNWVGGAGWSPLRADFVPPPETEVERLLEDLARFVSETGGSPLVRAAIAHAQFETIHPFIDGNGRTGRALIHTVLRRGEAVRGTVIPISTVFAGDPDSYIAGLTAFRADPQRLDDWIVGFATAAELAASGAVALADAADALAVALADALVAWRSRAGLVPAHPRRDAVVLRLLDALPTTPVLRAAFVSERFSVSPAAAHRALTELADAGILGRSKDHKGKLICWTADAYLDLAALTERSHRIGGGDTRDRKPRLGPPAPSRRRASAPPIDSDAEHPAP